MRGLAVVQSLQVDKEGTVPLGSECQDGQQESPMSPGAEDSGFYPHETRPTCEGD